MSSIYELISLFGVALLAATIFPAQSELALAGLAHFSTYSTVLLVLVATAGNVLGAVINWGLGRYVRLFETKPWFPFSKNSLDKAATHYEKWGIWSLLLAWVPFIGDPLTLVAGMMRAPLGIFLLLVTIGKAGRYVAVVWII